ncbi:PIG-L deacetylase family protein [Streptomyces sp. NPDC048290]|uniref:PIG-L deacetylase family protein n=1 Tax=Streptomyces sp. NPDC048290 TaxID=3155811 RepID=UPI00343108DC
MADDKRGSIQVISAHSGDFVWRAGGALALYAEGGYDVRIVCLSYGERGESQGLWKQDGMTVKKAKAGRRAEAVAAAEALGADITFLDLGDYPLRIDATAVDRIVAEMRAAQPQVLLTHVASDPYNRDHNAAHEATLLARQVAQAAGHDPGTTPIGAPQVLQFEPHQPEQCGFVPNLLLDITPVFERKRKAMECMGAQSHLMRYYTDLALRRGVQAVRNGGRRSIVQAEAYQRVFPVVGQELL